MKIISDGITDDLKPGVQAFAWEERAGTANVRNKKPTQSGEIDVKQGAITDATLI